MTTCIRILVLPFLLTLLGFAAPLRAELVRIEVASRANLRETSHLAAGTYEELIGTFHFTVDPTNSANRIIADIDLAPRNAAGRVEFSANFRLLKPKDAARGNGTALFEVSNRGGRAMVDFFSPGDRFLMEQGFTLLWVGWQFDVP